MKVVVYVPFATGDVVNGFKYEGEEITPKKYVKMENDEYYTHRRGVDYMVTSSLGNNMAINDYDKRKINVKKQNYNFHVCNGHIRNINGREITTAELDRHWANKEQFGLIVYLDIEEMKKKPDLEIDLKMWIQDSMKVMNITELSEEEKIFHLPKMDFKIDFEDSHAVLKNCKFAKLMTSVKKAGEPVVTSFAMIIERIIFTKS